MLQVRVYGSGTLVVLTAQIVAEQLKQTNTVMATATAQRRQLLHTPVHYCK